MIERSEDRYVQSNTYSYVYAEREADGSVRFWRGTMNTRFGVVEVQLHDAQPNWDRQELYACLIIEGTQYRLRQSRTRGDKVTILGAKQIVGKWVRRIAREVYGS